MYEPDVFAIHDSAALHARIAEIGVAHLVISAAARSSETQELASSMLPLVLDPRVGPYGSLLGHLARANPDWRDAHGCQALAIFTGPDAYISPSWYPSKVESGKVVPTWNYEVVHAHGEIVVHDDPAWVRNLVTRLTDRHEAGRPNRWQVTDAPDAYIDALLKGIVGIELRITRLVGKAKASQNRPVADQRGVIDGLAAGTAPQQAMSDLVATATHAISATE
jgi:transcriptional regulator